MEHCDDSYEAFYIVIIPSNVTIAEKFVNNNLMPSSNPLQFLLPDLGKYFEWDLSTGLSGVRLSQCADHGTSNPVMELEFVHYLPYIIPNAQYIVTRIHTKIPYSDSTSIFDIMKRITNDIDLIVKYTILYGVSDGPVTNNDGLLMNFVTDLGGMSTNGYTAITINQLLQGIKNSAFNNDQYHESIYIGQNNYHQWYLDFYTNGSISVPLYWPKHLFEFEFNGKNVMV